jgi:ribonucleoside-diphosphate reductase alpha chain
MATSNDPPADLAIEPRLDESARRILEARYLDRDGKGRVLETPRQIFWRVARHVASVERSFGQDPEAWARRFYPSLARLEFLPNSPTLMNAGRDLGQLSACFVLPVEDSVDAIFKTVGEAARIQKTGGGTGFSFSRLRPRDDVVSTTGGHASGPVSFMRVFNAATDAIHQGGVRRGANMGILRVDHPDVLEFIDAKTDPRELKNFNVSVAATDVFMRAVEQDGEYDLVSPRTGESAGKLRARDVFDRIVRRAWESGEPGMIFIDRVNAVNPTPQLGAMESTNPCGELPLLPYESCNLGSLDISKFIDASGKDLEWRRLGEVARLAVRFLDDVIEANRYPVPQIDVMTKTNRKIGLGVMGFADTLLALGIPYDSEDALAFAERLMAFIDAEARAASRDLAIERGPFPAFGGSLWEKRGEARLRNATVTTIAPTGTISLIAGCSSGIEPLFALAFSRRALDGKAVFNYVHPALEPLARKRGFWTEELRDEVLRRGSLGQLASVPDDVKRVFRTAYEIAPEWHVRMQAAFQKHVENAVSKTINLPRQATAADVGRAYRLAYELGCKGITVYRDGTREQQILSVAAHQEAESPRAPSTCGIEGCG